MWKKERSFAKIESRNEKFFNMAQKFKKFYQKVVCSIEK